MYCVYCPVINNHFACLFGVSSMIFGKKRWYPYLYVIISNYFWFTTSFLPFFHFYYFFLSVCILIIYWGKRVFMEFLGKTNLQMSLKRKKDIESSHESVTGKNENGCICHLKRSSHPLKKNTKRTGSYVN